MKLAKEPTPVTVLAGKEAEAVRQQRYEKGKRQTVPTFFSCCARPTMV